MHKQLKKKKIERTTDTKNASATIQSLLEVHRKIPIEDRQATTATRRLVHALSTRGFTGRASIYTVQI